MTDSEVEILIERLRHAKAQEAFYKSMASDIEDQLGDDGIEVKHRVTHTSWRRVRAQTENASNI